MLCCLSLIQMQSHWFYAAHQINGINRNRIRLHNSHSRSLALSHTHNTHWEYYRSRVLGFVVVFLFFSSSFVPLIHWWFDTQFEWKTFGNKLWPMWRLYDPFIRRIFGRSHYLTCMCARLRPQRMYLNSTFLFEALRGLMRFSQFQQFGINE